MTSQEEMDLASERLRLAACKVEEVACALGVLGIPISKDLVLQARVIREADTTISEGRAREINERSPARA